jgi:hypothetical protein
MHSKTLLLSLLLSMTVVLVNAQCTSDLDCNLCGKCSENVCMCRPGWVGTDCGQLDFLPAPLEEAFYRNDSASWGGSVIFVEGNYHMFLAFMEGHCGLNSWQPNSAIYAAVSASGSPKGPYVNETKILDWFSHNPAATLAPDGSLLVWHIGCGSRGGGFNFNCTNGTTPPPPPPPPVRFENGGQCLVSAGTFPCWTGGTGKVCPLIMGSCASPSSEWSVEGEAWTNAASSDDASLNIDCNACTPGTVVKLFGAGSSDVSFNKTSGQIYVTQCPGMCLSTGASGKARAPCGGGGEPWMLTQIQLASCDEADTLGWSSSPAVAPSLTEPESGGTADRRRLGAAASGTYPAPCTDTNVLVSATGSVDGPWVQSGILQGNRYAPIYEADNPAPIHFSTGETWIMFRSWHPPGNTTTPIGIARSDTASWNSSYTILNVTYPQFASVKAMNPSYIPLEDPTMWVDQESQTFHALFHNMGGCSTVGCHAFSQDGMTWFLASSGPYTTEIMYEDGSNVTVARRERPHLIFNKLGQPAFLSNGVQRDWSDDHTFTHVQPINVPWP